MRRDYMELVKLFAKKLLLQLFGCVKIQRRPKRAHDFQGVTESLWDKTQRSMLYPDAPLATSRPLSAYGPNQPTWHWPVAEESNS